MALHPSLTEYEAALWQRLEDYAIGPQDAALSFAARLARENGWSRDYAARVIYEYKRFCFLAMTAGHPVTPSDQVDQAWHLHLTYSRDYWQRFCPQVLGADLHHGPTAGGGAEGSRYHEQYAQTLRAYDIAFSAPPPPDIWSPVALRFGLHTWALRLYPDRILLLKDARGIARLVLVLGAALMAGVLIGRAL